jgi:hypothetical protein
MRLGQPACGFRRNRAHREMDGARVEAVGDAFWPQHDAFQRPVVRQKRDHDPGAGRDLARGARRPGAELDQRCRFLRSAVPDGHSVPLFEQPARGARPHATEAQDRDSLRHKSSPLILQPRCRSRHANGRMAVASAILTASPGRNGTKPTPIA